MHIIGTLSWCSRILRLLAEIVAVQSVLSSRAPGAFATSTPCTASMVYLRTAAAAAASATRWRTAVVAFRHAQTSRAQRYWP